MRSLIAATLLSAALIATPADAQSRRDGNSQPSQPSPLAQQAMASGEQPDVLLDVPNLSVDELTIDVQNLQLDISLNAQLANLLKLTAGANASIEQVKIGLKGVKAQATLIVRLENVRAIIERTLQTLDNNPQIVQGLLSTVNNSVNTVGGVANNAVGTVGGVANNLLRNGQVLDLARAGLTQLSQTVNASGQTVRRVRDSSGKLMEVVTDSANRVISSRSVAQ